MARSKNSAKVSDIIKSRQEDRKKPVISPAMKKYMQEKREKKHSANMVTKNNSEEKIKKRTKGYDKERNSKGDFNMASLKRKMQDRLKGQ